MVHTNDLEKWWWTCLEPMQFRFIYHNRLFSGHFNWTMSILKVHVANAHEHVFVAYKFGIIHSEETKTPLCAPLSSQFDVMNVSLNQSWICCNYSNWSYLSIKYLTTIETREINQPHWICCFLSLATFQIVCRVCVCLGFGISPKHSTLQVYNNTSGISFPLCTNTDQFPFNLIVKHNIGENSHIEIESNEKFFKSLKCV